MISETEFVPASPNSAKVMCSVCLATGWGPAGHIEVDDLFHTSWQIKHAGNHPYPCTCGRAFISAAARAAHLYPRQHVNDTKYRGKHRPMKAAQS